MPRFSHGRSGKRMHWYKRWWRWHVWFIDSWRERLKRNGNDLLFDDFDAQMRTSTDGQVQRRLRKMDHASFMYFNRRLPTAAFKRTP